MVDEDDLLYFPTIYSVGLGLYVLVGMMPARDGRGTTGRTWWGRGIECLSYLLTRYTVKTDYLHVIGGKTVG